LTIILAHIRYAGDLAVIVSLQAIRNYRLYRTAIERQNDKAFRGAAKQL